MSAIGTFLVRIKLTFMALAAQGISPSKLALAIALGLVVGVFPVLGTTTVLCTVFALALRLNLVAVHAVHYAVTPLQLLLIIPFVRVGEHVLDATPQPLSIDAGLALVSAGMFEAIATLLDAIVHATLGWTLLAPIAITVVFVVVKHMLERLVFPSVAASVQARS